MWPYCCKISQCYSSYKSYLKLFKSSLNFCPYCPHKISDFAFLALLDYISRKPKILHCPSVHVSIISLPNMQISFNFSVNLLPLGHMLGQFLKKKTSLRFFFFVFVNMWPDGCKNFKMLLLGNKPQPKVFKCLLNFLLNGAHKTTFQIFKILKIEILMTFFKIFLPMLGLMGTSRKYMWYHWHHNVQSHLGLIQCTCLKMPCKSKHLAVEGNRLKFGTWATCSIYMYKG